MTFSFGGLPGPARRRIAAAKESSVWSAPVTPAEDAALRSVGFEPAGTVTASIPSWPFGYQYSAALRSDAARFGRSTQGPYGTSHLIDDALTAKRAGGFTHDYVEGDYGGLLPDIGFSWQKVVAEAREHQLVKAVVDRLRTEAVALAAHGIVSIRLAWKRRPELDVDEVKVHDVNAIGLAVTAKGVAFESPLFTAALSAGDVCALVREGLAPSQIVVGVGVVRANMGNRTRRHMRSLGQVEVPQLSEAIEKSLALATADLERNGAVAGEVIVGCQSQVTFERIGGAGLESHVRLIGTAMRRFKAPDRAEVPTILRLDDRPSRSRT